jgi:hypothetical protein
MNFLIPKRSNEVTNLGTTHHDVIKQMSDHVGYNTQYDPGMTPEDRLRGDRNHNTPLMGQRKGRLREEAARALIEKWVSERNGTT